MTRYIIKKHYEATETNLNFKDEVKDYYQGKHQETIGKNYFPTNYFIIEYGYSTKAAATRGLKATQELCDWETARGHWNVSCELIEVNV